MTSEEVNPDAPDATGVFHPMSVRVLTEREKRAEDAEWLMNYCHPYLDDALRGMRRRDLVLIGAPAGVGKTDFALSIGTANARKERRVGIFALEAEPQELERRVKYAWIATEVWRRNIERKGELNYKDWLLDRCQHIVGDLDDAADRWFAANLSTLWTFYRGKDFGLNELIGMIRKHHRMFDLIIIDHLHYIDFGPDDTENEAITEIMKALRAVQLDAQKPIILVAHLRKGDRRFKQLAPELEDFLGSKQIVNVCTQAITISPATNIEAPKWWLAPTFMAIRKDRDSGTGPLVALTMFDKRNRSYEDTYTLGRLTKGGTEWEQLKPGDGMPGWATCHRQTELQLG